MKRYLKVFSALLIISLTILALFKWTALKMAWLKIKRSPGGAPSMIRALPFDILKEKRKSRLPSLKERLTLTQVLIENIVGLPKGAPLGKYVRVSVVLETPDQKTAERLQGRKGHLATLILDTIQKFPYERFQSPSGLREFKRVLSQKILFLYGDKVQDISIVEFELREARRR